ncbi:MAG: histone deacetylase family protein [Rhodospirillales bacterium]|jgi:acetoin utilization deacetylase AcuC-like enzyme|nr:histone deacetylase family protein [Rhodospirillales bacterium]
MTTFIYWHDDCLAHDPGAGHPEQPARLRSVLEALRGEDMGGLAWLEAPLGQAADIARVHSDAHFASVIDAVPATGHRALDPDTVLSPGSGNAALRAVGGITSAVDAVFAGEADNAFCALRPPGHHAEPARAMGFCLFNNVAIGAARACHIHGAERVAVIDFDVHHGNGTQAMFEGDGDLFYGSSHQFPAYPGTGAASERGVGNIFNVPLAPGSGPDEFRTAYEDTIFPALDEFGPEMILISAGFDAHRDDPLCALNLEAGDFTWITGQLTALAHTHCQGRLVSTLEGGYDLEALAQSAQAHVSVLMEA